MNVLFQSKDGWLLLQLVFISCVSSIYFHFNFSDIVQAAADAPSSKKCKVCLPGEAGETPGDRFLVAEHY